MKIWIGCTAPIEEALKTLSKVGIINSQRYRSLRGVLDKEEYTVINFLNNISDKRTLDHNKCLWCGEYHLTYIFTPTIQ